MSQQARKSSRKSIRRAGSPGGQNVSIASQRSKRSSRVSPGKVSSVAKHQKKVTIQSPSHSRKERKSAESRQKAKGKGKGKRKGKGTKKHVWVPQSGQPPQQLTLCHTFVQKFTVAKPKPGFDEYQSKWYGKLDVHITVIIFTCLTIMLIIALGFWIIGLGTTVGTFSFPFKFLTAFVITAAAVIGFVSYCNPNLCVINTFLLLTMLSAIMVFISGTISLILHVAANEEARWIRKAPFDTTSYDGLNILIDTLACYGVFIYLMVVFMCDLKYRNYYSQKFLVSSNTGSGKSSRRTGDRSRRK